MSRSYTYLPQAHPWRVVGQLYILGGIILTGETEALEEKRIVVKFVHHNRTWTDLDKKPGRRGERSATNRLSYDTGRLQDTVFTANSSEKKNTGTFLHIIRRPC
jgi:hypothetical protein